MMAIKRTTERSGVFVIERQETRLEECGSSVEFAEDVKTELQEIGKLDPILEHLEAEAKAIMVQGGFMDDAGSWIDVPPEKLDSMPSRVRDAESVILRVRRSGRR
jgi:hypothetical protein